MDINKENIRNIVFLTKFIKYHMLKSGLKNRYRHTIAVSLLMREKSKEIGLCPIEAEILGLVHDLGYCDDFSITGFHPIDGYRYLIKIDKTIADRMVLHTSTPEEAELRHIILPDIIMDDYAKLLSYADSRVTGDGRVVSFEERLQDITSRYGNNHLVSIANTKAWKRLKEQNKTFEIT
jgi:HD superfamily phosphodiesterase